VHLHVEFEDGQSRDIPVSAETALVVGWTPGLAPDASLSLSGVSSLELVHGDTDGAGGDPHVQEVARSAETGQFVTQAQAEQHPDTTVVETIEHKPRVLGRLLGGD
jgi:hypothetical protein